ncbi:MAG: hypothetical protein ACHQQ3_00020 [Gemmatimonadales bacterium]
MRRIRRLFDSQTPTEESLPAEPAPRGHLLDRVVGRSAGDYVDVSSPERIVRPGESDAAPAPLDPDFASALRAKLDEVQDRLEAEELRLAEVERAASEYLADQAPPRLRLIR